MKTVNLEQATDSALDLIGEQFNIKRFPREKNRSYRCRMLALARGIDFPDPQLHRPWYWWLTFLWTWQADALSMFAVLLIHMAWGRSMFWSDGLWVELRANCWPARTWYRQWGGTTFCHGGMLGPGRASLTHERHHVEQTEARMLAGFIMGLASLVVALLFGSGPGHCLLALEIPWFGSWLLGYGASVGQACLRGEDPYAGSHLEEAAYALTEDDLADHEMGDAQNARPTGKK